jgi:hypothetical protein
VPGRVALVNAHMDPTATVKSRGKVAACTVGPLRCKNWKLIDQNLWLVSISELVTEGVSNFSPAYFCSLLSELRCEFQYSIFHAPPAAIFNEATIFGQLCQGMVLVVHAQHTKRIRAQRIKDVLQAANVRLLGTVLAERTFPIPERIYRRL